MKSDPAHTAAAAKCEDACCPTEREEEDDEGMGMPMTMIGFGYRSEEAEVTELDHPTLDEVHSQKWYEAPRRGGDAT